MLKGYFSLPRPRFSFCPRMSTTPEPFNRRFVPVQQSEVIPVCKPAGFKFRLVSYNVLAQAYVKSTFFPHSPAPCLRWKARSQAILKILENLEADFLCLQEVDEFDTFYKRNMENLGYVTCYIQRSGRKRDGCGIFYKPNCAELVVEEKIDYNDLADLDRHGRTDSSMDKDSSLSTEDKSVIGVTKNELRSGLNVKDNQDRKDSESPHVRLKRDCVGVMTAFRLNNSSGTHVIIANTHLFWDPEWSDVKIAQAKYLLSRLAGFKKLVSDKFNCAPSVIVAGDFNSVPGDQVYRYLISGTSSETSENLPIPLSSVYAFVGGEPEFTNCTPGFTGTLDYILFSPSGDVKPVSYLELPVTSSPEVDGGLPNYYHPSDHLPIGAEFEVL